MLRVVSPLKTSFPIRPIKPKKVTRSFQVRCSNSDPKNMAKQFAVNSTEIILKPVIDVLKSIDDKLTKIDSKFDQFVKKSDGTIVQMVDTESLKK